MLKFGSQFSVLRGQRSFPGGRREPLQKFFFEFAGRGAKGATVVGVGDLPQDNFWVAGGDAPTVADGDVAVFDAVN
jgi:hypothetical protein